MDKWQWDSQATTTMFLFLSSNEACKLHSRLVSFINTHVWLLVLLFTRSLDHYLLLSFVLLCIQGWYRWCGYKKLHLIRRMEGGLLPVSLHIERASEKTRRAPGRYYHATPQRLAFLIKASFLLLFPYYCWPSRWLKKSRRVEVEQQSSNIVRVSEFQVLSRVILFTLQFQGEEQLKILLPSRNDVIMLSVFPGERLYGWTHIGHTHITMKISYNACIFIRQQ